MIDYKKKYLKYKNKYIQKVNYLQKGGVSENLEFSFKLMSYNVYLNRGYDYDKETNVSNYINSLESENKPDIICTQEEPINSFIGGDYQRLHTCPENINTTENVAVYYKKNDSNRPKFIECIKQNDRHAIIFEYNNTTVANLHLDGGRYVDTKLKTNYNTLIENKLALLNAVISKKPDIILGDFNSVYSSDVNQLNNFYQNQYDYFDKFHDYKNIEEINRWNSEPYQVLTENNYNYAVPYNQSNSFTNFRGETIVDAIWYKHIDSTNTQILDSLNSRTGGVPSDHNPVITTIIPLASQSKPSIKKPITTQEEPAKIQTHEIPIETITIIGTVISVLIFISLAN